MPSLKLPFRFSSGIAGSWIYLPTDVKVLLSTDGKKFKPVSALVYTKDGQKGFSIDAKKARYVKIVAKNTPVIPDGKPGAGNPAWLFIDEITID